MSNPTVLDCRDLNATSPFLPQGDVDRKEELMAIRILLADRQKIDREAIRALLEKQPGMEVVAEAENGHKAVELARQFSPDVILMDVQLPAINGVEVARLISKEMPNVRIIALSARCAREYVAEMLGMSALGYLLKDCNRHELIEAIRSVNRNEPYLARKIIRMVVEAFLQQLTTTESGTGYVLTAKELEVFRNLVKQKNITQIFSTILSCPTTLEKPHRKVMPKASIQEAAKGAT